MRAFYTVTMSTIAAAALLLAAPLSAGESKIALGEVSISDSHAHVDARDVREIAESALGRASWPDLKKSSIVSVSVVQMESVPSGRGSSQLTCLVSATLREKKTGNVYAVVESRARKEQKTVTPADERATVSVALENAISRLPAVVR